MARKQSLIELLKEDVRMSDDRSRHIIDKYEKEFDGYKSKAKLLYNKFTNVAIGDILDENHADELKRISEASEKFSDKMLNINDELEEMASDLYDEYDKNGDRRYKALSSKSREISNKYHGLSKHLNSIYYISSEVNDIFDKLKDDEDKIKSLNRYKDEH